MELPPDTPFGQSRSSRLMAEMRKKRRQTMAAVDPARKMNTAFLLSILARKFLIAGLKAQGFSDYEIREVIRKRKR